MKSIVIIGYRKQVLQTFANQLQRLFGDGLRFRLIADDAPVRDTSAENSILLAQSYDVLARSGICASGTEPVIFIRAALQTAGIRKLEELPEGKMIVAAGDNMETATDLVKALVRLGLPCSRIRPASLSCKETFRDKTVVVSGIPEKEIPQAGKVIDLYSPVLDVDTILDIGLKLGKKDILIDKDIRRDYIEFWPVHEGVASVLERANSLGSSVKILLDVIDGTVISVEQTGKIRACNDRVETIFGVRPEELIGKDGIKLFPEIPFRRVIQGKIPMVESLRTIGGDSMVVTVKPIFNSGHHYGAIAVLKRFHDEENRQHKLRTLSARKGYRTKYHFDDIAGESRAITECKSIARRMAGSDSSILIMGESGTGKEMFAQAIHNASARKAYQFVAVNCGAIPETLLESELFGYEEGAFTGARKGGKLGFFELAHKGTLFLDEIAEMSKTLQKRLLRVLQEREVTRLGGSSVIHVDVRIIAATNQDLRGLAEVGDFREDLYYRLSVLPLKVPPLREHTEDVRILATWFQQQSGNKFTFTEAAWRELERHSWPGNVRELRNYIEYFSNLSHAVVGINELSQVVPLYTSFRLKEGDPAYSAGMGDGRISESGMLVLRILKEGMENRRRLGRRSISRMAKEREVFLGEQEIRGILKTLEQQGMVIIHPTKAGTVITAKGLAALKVQG